MAAYPYTRTDQGSTVKQFALRIHDGHTSAAYCNQL